jgi:hypothetical protein
VIEDDRNKAVFFCGHSSWAFTGLGQMGSYRTSEWFSNTVARVGSFQDSVEQLRSRATTRLRNTDPQLRRLALVGVGFADERVDSGVPVQVARYPVLTVISNFYNATHGWQAVGSDRFEVGSWSMPPATSFILFESGVPLRPGRKKRLIRLLNELFERQLGPLPTARLLCRAIRQEHDDNPTGPIGRNIMCTVVMKDAVPGDPNYSGGLWPLAEDAAERDYFKLPAQNPPLKYYFYFPGEGGDRKHFGPDSVCAGVEIRNVKMAPTGPADARMWSANAETRMR